MKHFLFLLLICCPSAALAWNLSDHRDISKLSLQDVSAEWGLNKPVAVRPLDSLLEKIRPLRPEIADRWHFSHYLQVNPKIDLGHAESHLLPQVPLKERKEMTPLEILGYYSTDPDDGRDQDLFVRDEKGTPQYAYPDQKWFGFARGSNSQAFRHIEKPPFRLDHPVATFGFPLRKLGEASRRAEIYHRMSLLAFALGEDYWGWRFLANAFHYLEDLHQPYHAGQIPPSLMKKGIAALSWGRKDLGFIGTFAHIVSNSHRFFESYVEKPPKDSLEEKASAFKALGGQDLISYRGSFESLAVDVRDASNLVYGRLAEDVSTIADPRLAGSYEFRSDEKSQDDPAQFVNEGPDFAAADRDLFSIVAERFASAGRILRTAVHAILSEKEAGKEAKEDPKSLLSALDGLLGPSPFQQESEENP